MARLTTPGDPHPLGVSLTADGVNVAVYSESATRVELCLFDADGAEERVVLPERSAHVHHGHVAGVAAGQRYGLRVDGPWNPADGARANPSKLLIDPYARAIDGDVTIAPKLLGHRLDAPLQRDDRDDAAQVPKCVVVDPSFDWGGDRPPATPIDRTIIYETHVKGISRLHPEVPPEIRGTYAGLAHPAIVDHLVLLGVTAVELLPVHHFLTEGFLDDLGLSNYWGYSTIGFFAPHGAYAAAGQGGGQVDEFKHLVKTLHGAGIEVLLDVVFNHTNEGNAQGPTLSFRGIDNTTYYRLVDGDRARHFDVTGTGNTMNVSHPATLRLIMDSLRYWVEEMHVDGFRFDLATALARDPHDFDRSSAFFDAVHQDPIVGRVKLIAEPWDVGPGGYQLGNFPADWSEWNGRFRDDVRDFWKGTPGTLAALGSRLAGSADVFHSHGRRPTASINFVTAHDGYTLADAVAYELRHNQDNGEDNRDGHHDNRTWNGGIEGPTGRADVVENRRRRQRSMMATLLLAQGVPMLSGGDEIGRTQRGNNNAYCQDNEVSWYDWAAADHEFEAFTRRLIELRLRHPVFRRRTFFEGAPTMGSTLDDIGWFRPDGDPMQPDDWHVGHARALSVFLNGNALGHDEPDHSFLMLCNAGSDSVAFHVPRGLGGQRWRVVVDTADPSAIGETVEASDDWKAGAWTFVLLEREELTPEVP